MPLKRDAKYFDEGHSSPHNPAPEHFEEEHVHDWFPFDGHIICKGEECATIISMNDVARRLNYWMELEKDAWKRRVMSMRKRLEEADGGT